MTKIKALYPVTESNELITELKPEHLQHLYAGGASVMHKQGFYGEGKTVAIIDSGIAPDHPEFIGKNIELVNKCGYNHDGSDDNGHGTHCAALICGNNVGFAPKADIISYKVITALGWIYNTQYILDCMHDLDERLNNGQEVCVLSMSLGVRQNEFTAAQIVEFSQLITSLNDKGCHIVVSAGNEGEDPFYKYPARFENPIVCGSTNEMMEPSYFSSVHDQVDFCMVGENVVSASHKKDSSGNYGYVAMSGTSMATPQLSGCVTLLCEKHEKLFNYKAENHSLYESMKYKAIDIGALGVDFKTGAGFFSFKDDVVKIEFDLDSAGSNILKKSILPGTIKVNGSEETIEAMPFLIQSGNFYKTMIELRSLWEKQGGVVIYNNLPGNIEHVTLWR